MKLNLSFEEWDELTYINYHKHDKSQRMGQFYFNELHRQKPVLAEQFVMGFLLPDPFYKDEDLNDFLNTAKLNWGKYD